MGERTTRLLVGTGSILATILLLAFHVQIHEAWWFVSLFTLLYHGSVLCQYFFKSKAWPLIILGCIGFLGIQSLIQTGWYYAGGMLGQISDVVSLIGTILLIQAFALFMPQAAKLPLTFPHPKEEKNKIAFGLILLILAISVTIVILRAALLHATTDSIRTPWPLMPSWTLLAIASVWVSLLMSVIFIRRPIFATIHSMLAMGATTAIAPLLYKIGFGFDGFLHVASEQILLRTGTLSPKPLYYIGQYVFTTWLSRLTDLPIAEIDRWLVPIASALLISLCFYVVFKNESPPSFAILTLLPISGFIATTPQSFAYVLGLSGLILCLGVEKKTVTPMTPILFAVWAIAVHPLAGLPILFVILAVTFKKNPWILWPLILLAGCIIPILFALIGSTSGTPIAWNVRSLLNPQTWSDGLRVFLPWIGNHFVLWPAWATLVSRSTPIILFILGISAVIIVRLRSLAIYVAAALILFIAAIALKATGDFAFLIDYERGNYADRLNTIATLCLIPPASIGLGRFLDRARPRSRYLTMACAMLLVFFATGLAYNALPRNDALVIGHGWSVSANDIEAVRFIDRDAGERPYTVLANQSVSAAAVRTLGFKRYAEPDVFFYPIPTGGPLYEVFLRMTYNEPSRETATDAALLGKSGLVYIVINDYWWKADIVSEETGAIADASWTTDDGKVRVYTFDFRNNSNAPTATSTR